MKTNKPNMNLPRPICKYPAKTHYSLLEVVLHTDNVAPRRSTCERPGSVDLSWHVCFSSFDKNHYFGTCARDKYRFRGLSQKRYSGDGNGSELLTYLQSDGLPFVLLTELRVITRGQAERV